MARTFDKRIARIVGEAGAIESEALAKLIAAAAEENKPLSTVLVSQGAIDENELLGLLCLRLRVPPINLHDCTLDTDVVRLIPKEIATGNRIVPLSRIENVLTVAVSNPSDVVTLDQVRNSTGCELRLVLSLDDAIEGSNAPPDWRVARWWRGWEPRRSVRVARTSPAGGRDRLPP